MDKEILLKLLNSGEENDNEKQIIRLLNQLSSIENNKQIIDIEKYIAELRTLSENLRQVNLFKIGDIVRWKKGLKNKRIPEYDVPAIVVEVLDNPIFDDKVEIGSTYYHEPLDIVLGLIIKGEFLTFHYDSRRMELYQR